MVRVLPLTAYRISE
jgi:hypothetical protein